MFFVSPLEVLLSLKSLAPNKEDCQIVVTLMKETLEGEALLSLDLLFDKADPSMKLNGIFTKTNMEKAGYPTEEGLYGLP
jgi:hypothetical protein